MKKCPFCGADIEDSARFCLYCMRPLTEKEQIFPHKKKNPQWWVTVAAIVALVMIAVLLLSKMLNPSVEDPVLSSVPSESTTNSTESSTQLHIHSYSVENTAIEYLKAEATCTAPAVYYYSCTCGEMGSKVFSYGEIKNHTIVIDRGYPASCVSTGLTEGKYCATCNTILVPQVVIKPKGHTEVIDPAIPATCTTSGLTEGKHCATCNTIFVAQVIVGVKGHTYNQRNMADEYLLSVADCTSSAVYYYSCTCGAISSKTFSYGDPLEHTIVADLGYEPTCSATGLTDGTHCSVCQTVITAQEAIKAKGHTYAEGDTPTPCQVCGTMGTQKTQAVVLICPETPFLCDGIYNVYEITWHIDYTTVNRRTDWWLKVMIKHTTSVENPPYPTLTIPGARWSHSSRYLGKTELVFMLPAPEGTYEVLVE